MSLGCYWSQCSTDPESRYSRVCRVTHNCNRGDPIQSNGAPPRVHMYINFTLRAKFTCWHDRHHGITAGGATSILRKSLMDSRAATSVNSAPSSTSMSSTPS